MSSEDVIELGSSDEDTEPAPKRKKSASNIMVQIPPMLPGVTIKPAISVSKINPVSIAKGSLGKAVTVTKVQNSPVINPYANKNKLNGKSLKIQSMGKQNLPKIVPIMVARHINKAAIHPQVLSMVGKPMLKGQPNKPNPTNFIKPISLNALNPVSMMKAKPNMPQIGNKQTGNSFGLTVKRPILPPGITITKTAKATKNVAKPKPSNKKPGMRMKKPSLLTNKVLTVETVDLDDDEPETSTSSAGPQWYMRPEEQPKEEATEKSPGKSTDIAIESTEQTLDIAQNKASPKKSPEKMLKKSPDKQPVADPLSLEEANNKEPDKQDFIEITIEDSPIKPILSQKSYKVGVELAITIEDSPGKPGDKTPPVSGSEDEHEKVKEKHSKKKLNYPKEVEPQNVIEIEIEPLQPKIAPNEVESVKLPDITRIVDDVIEIEESPIKPAEKEQILTPKKKQPKPQVKMAEIDFKVLEDKEKEEFHPTYQAFIELCFKLENSDDMKKIIEKKIKSYYRQVPKDYTESEMFTEIVLSKTAAMKAAPEKMYLYIKDIVDELDAQRKLSKKQAEEKKEEQEKFLYGEESEFDMKRQRQIRKLEKTLKKLHRAIQKLEEQEVDFDDEEDSVYLLTERYKERMVRVHAKLCQLTNTKMPSEPRVQIDARPGQPKGPAKRLEKWINKKVPIGTPLPFPDFHDVLRCVRDANQQDKLGWNEADIMEEARDLFTRCGKKLQRRRQENEWRLAASRIQAEVDPAEDSQDLQKKLAENKRVAAKREAEVLNKYADRQNLLKLEAVEIGDKEADESPVESDEEEQLDDGSLENKEKRKERLKRLLQEKSRKRVDKKYNQVTKTLDGETKDKEADNTGHADSEKDKECEKHGKAVEIEFVELAIPNKESEDNHINDDCEDDKSLSKNDKVHSLSDDSRLESDIDELHLLQNLHSENEINSSTLESDSDSPIAISDGSTMSDSSLGGKKKPSSDVISIENSSYSESEEKKDVEEKETKGFLVIEEIEEADNSNDVSEMTNEKNVETEANNIEYIESEEVTLQVPDHSDNENQNDISLDTETCDYNISSLIEDSQDGSPGDAIIETNQEILIEVNIKTETCVNLKDDNIISIPETATEDSQNSELDDVDNEADNDIPNEINLDTETCVNLRDDNISIHETIIEDSQNGSPKDADIETNNEISNKINLDSETCVNLRDDDISIHETVIEGSQSSILDDANKEISNKINLDTETCVNLKDDSISIHETVIEDIHNSPRQEITEDFNKNDNTDPVENIEVDSADSELNSKEIETSNIVLVNEDDVKSNSVEKEGANQCELKSVKTIEDDRGNLNDSCEKSFEVDNTVNNNAMDITEKTDISNQDGTLGNTTTEMMDVDTYET